MKSIVIYDDKCSVCTAFGTLGRQVIPLGYSTGQAKKLMAAQFGKNYGFALMVFTPDKVFWGAEAAAEITRKGYNSFIGFFNDFIHFIYPFVVGSLNTILHRERLPEAPKCMSKKLADKGSMILTAKAYSEFNKIVKVW